MKELSLVIMAAGMGSRFGGLKQMEKFGKNGETLLYYSVKDALKAGFNKFIFVIRKDIKEDFENIVLSKMPAGISVQLAFQELDSIPSKFLPLPIQRKKPWGTAHALLCAGKYINGDFAVINADDYYGENSFKQLADAIISKQNQNKDGKNQFILGAYKLVNTLSENGYVSRGVCFFDNDFNLLSMKEVLKIKEQNGEIIDLDTNEKFSKENYVNMNLWAFSKEFISQLENGFASFLEKNINDEKAEYYLTKAVFENPDKNHINVIKVQDKWYGVTYKEDAPLLRKILQEKI